MAEIQGEYRSLMNGLAEGIDKIMNGETRPKKICFVLLLTEFNKIEGGRVNYISNGERADIVATLHQILARFEGRAVDPTPATGKQ